MLGRIFIALFLSILLLPVEPGNCQSVRVKSEIDSLEKELLNVKEDTLKAEILIKLSWRYSDFDSRRALGLARQSVLLGEKNKNKGITARAFSALGNAFDEKDDYTSALENYLKALKLFEELGKKRALGAMLNNIGVLYQRKLDWDKALEYYHRSLKIRIETRDEKGIASSLLVIGQIYNHKKNYSEAIKNYSEARSIMEKIGDKKNLSHCLNSLGELYRSAGDFKKALGFYKESRKLKEELKDLKSIALAYSNISTTYLNLKDKTNAPEFAILGVDLSIKSGHKNTLREAYLSLASAYAALGNYSRAYENHLKFSALNDSIYSLESNGKIAEMQAKYDKEKNEKEIQLLNNEKKIKALEFSKQNEELTKQKILRNSFLSGFGLILALSFLLYNRYALKTKSNRLLTLQKEEIEFQKQILEEQNKDIKDSIKYAKRIQEAVFPPANLVSRLLPESFIFYKPKDIVSGDFFWIEEKEGIVYFAAVDCTGHGVPGAFMSIVGHNLLNQAVNVPGQRKPSEILDAVNAGLNQTLRQTFEESTVKDGMDIALCSIDKMKMKLEFAGANNPVYLVRNSVLHELNGDKFPVGAFLGEELKKFNNQEIGLKKNDIIYVFTDGYADQFGGKNLSGEKIGGGKKFKNRQLKELLVSISDLDMENQMNQLQSKFDEWKGPFEQTDDVTIIGVRI